MTFAEKIIRFNQSLDLKHPLPEGISVMNPFKDEKVLEVSSLFYHKFYNDQDERKLILGINPGRFGAGVTGVPFTDTKRLRSECGIDHPGPETHEPSSAFIYEMIKAYGGLVKFYHDYYVGAICPLGFTSETASGRRVNYNYYDNRELLRTVYDFIVENIEKQLELGISRETCIILGCGKNEKFFRKLNEEKKYFKKVIALEHPRFIMQYRAMRKKEFVEKYLKVLHNP